MDTAVLMSSTSNRKKLIENLMKEADTYGFDGFNLDFESLKAEAGPHYVQFIREMSVACRKKGLVLSVDNYVPSSYTAFYNRKEQGIVADYVIVMAYDEPVSYTHLDVYKRQVLQGVQVAIGHFCHHVASVNTNASD